MLVFGGDFVSFSLLLTNGSVLQSDIVFGCYGLQSFFIRLLHEPKYNERSPSGVIAGSTVIRYHCGKVLGSLHSHEK